MVDLALRMVHRKACELGRRPKLSCHAKRPGVSPGVK